VTSMEAAINWSVFPFDFFVRLLSESEIRKKRQDSFNLVYESFI